MRVRRLLPALAVPVLVLAACGDADESNGDAEDTAQEEAPDEEAPDDEAPDDEAPDDEAPEEQDPRPEPAEVELTDPGDDPEEPLRVAAEEGEEFSASLDFEQELLGGEMQGEEIEAQEPQPIRAELSFVVEEAGDDGTTLAFTFDEVDMEMPPEMEEMQPEDQPDPTEAMEGLGGNLTLDEQARVVDVAIDSEELDPQTGQVLELFHQQMTGLSTPFPEEEVGEGATWEVQAQDSLGLPATEVTTVELVSRDGDDYELALEVETEAEEGAELPGGQPGMEMTLEEFSRAGQGSSQGSVTDGLPTSLQLELETSLNVEAPEEQGGSQQQDLREELNFERA